jgi:hypothetical protein
MDQAAGPVAFGVAAIAGVVMVSGVWAFWEDGFDADAALRLGLGIIACVVAVLLVSALAR